MLDIADVLLREEEDAVPYAYPDQFGFWTIGVGHCIDRKKGCGLPDAIITALLEHDKARFLAAACTLAGFSRLNPYQQAAVVSMVFQLGIEGVRGFHEFCRRLAAGDATGAAAAGLDSLWAREQTPRRAMREMQMLASGLWVPKELPK